MLPSPQLNRFILIMNSVFVGLTLLACFIVIVTGRRLYRWYQIQRLAESGATEAVFPRWSFLFFICSGCLLVFLLFVLGTEMTWWSL
ncbi:MAG: hypothetical protein AAF629_00190 [Chloroflexota bacterium]